MPPIVVEPTRRGFLPLVSGRVSERQNKIRFRCARRWWSLVTSGTLAAVLTARSPSLADGGRDTPCRSTTATRREPSAGEGGQSSRGERARSPASKATRRRSGNLIGKAAFAQIEFATDSPLVLAGFSRGLGSTRITVAGLSMHCRAGRGPRFFGAANGAVEVFAQ